MRIQLAVVVSVACLSLRSDLLPRSPDVSVGGHAPVPHGDGSVCCLDECALPSEEEPWIQSHWSVLELSSLPLRSLLVSARAGSPNYF